MGPFSVYEALKAPRFRDNRYMKVVKLSALSAGRLYSLYPYKIFLALISVKRSSRPQNHRQCSRKDYVIKHSSVYIRN
jgi:predicted transcriptional regulator with HTH domain